MHYLSLGQQELLCNLPPNDLIVFVEYSNTKLCTESVNVVLPGFNVFCVMDVGWQFECVWCLCC